MSEPQDVAEGYDEETVGIDPITRDEFGAAEIPPDAPYAVNEELVTEPIIDSVASRDDRLTPEVGSITAEVLGEEAVPSQQMVCEEVSLVADQSHMSAEESALHVTDDVE